MSWLKNAIQAFNKMTGSELSEEATEAEFVDAMESTPPLSEAIESSEALTALTSRITALENANKTFVTQESLDTTIQAAIKPGTDALAATKELITNNTNLIGTTKTELATEINAVKSTSSNSDAVPPADPSLKTETNTDEGNKDEMKLDSKDIFGATQLVPGLV